MGSALSSQASPPVGASGMDSDGDATELYLSQQMVRRKEMSGGAGGRGEREEKKEANSRPKKGEHSQKGSLVKRHQPLEQASAGAGAGTGAGTAWAPPFAMQPWQWQNIGGRRPPSLRRSTSTRPPAFTGLAPAPPAALLVGNRGGISGVGGVGGDRDDDLSTAAKTTTPGVKQALPSRGQFGRGGTTQGVRLPLRR